jgi:hypothetical protein
VAIDAAQDIAPVSLQPQAAPVDTYVQPAREANPGGQLADLAKGLQSVSSDLGSYFAAEKERKDKEDGILGEAEFHKNNQQGYADAIRDGKIPPQSSQAFVKAYKAPLLGRTSRPSSTSPTSSGVTKRTRTRQLTTSSSRTSYRRTSGPQQTLRLCGVSSPRFGS